MVVAAVNDNGDNVVFLLHLLSVIVGTGAAFLAPALLSRAQRDSKLSSNSTSALIATVMSPSLLLGGVFGGALVGMSDNVYDFSQMWLTFAGIFWLTSLGAATILYKPPFLTLPDLKKYHPLLGGVLHLSLAIMLVVMVWKPGY
ncbi:MAG: hypothetical protein CL470_02190 [Acidimicrobiaceae bacterium]|nr:hypothetical protein [Acidimicrobiaceae bacterium]